MINPSAVRQCNTLFTDLLKKDVEALGNNPK
jgi:hypothetical protein